MEKRILLIGMSFGLKAQNKIESTGNVGVGTTNPLLSLHIKNPVGGAAFGIERGDKLWRFDIQYTGDKLYLSNSSNANQLFTFAKEGRFGIGTTTPDQTLVVNGSISFDYGDSKSYNGFRRMGTKTEYYNIITGGTAVIHEFTGSNGAIMSLKNDGSVGIGTTDPKEELHLEGNLLIDAFESGNESGIFFRENFSTTNKYNLSILAYDHSGAYADGLSLNAYDGISFSTGSNNRNERMRISANGNVGIGTTNPGSWKLAVNGKIRAKEIKVETGWSDFVFKKEYNLPTLKEVETQIKEKGHLKDIPSASEVAANGIYLGEMDSKLLQKIEELTLYTIQQQKEIERLKLIEKRLFKIEKFLESKK